MNELMARRKLLLEQAEIQRMTLAKQINQLRPSATVVQGLDSMRLLRKQPIWMTSGILLLTILKPTHAISRSTKWLRVGWFVYQRLNSMRISQQQYQVEKLVLPFKEK